MKENPYRKGTIRYALYSSDWSDLTIDQIAEVLGYSKIQVRKAIVDIKRRTGYQVEYTRQKGGRPRKENSNGDG